jgi:hypothetical protein
MDMPKGRVSGSTRLWKVKRGAVGSATMLRLGGVVGLRNIDGDHKLSQVAQNFALFTGAIFFRRSATTRALTISAPSITAYMECSGSQSTELRTGVLLQ